MRIATILGAFSLGPRPLDLATAYTSERGMTGTELGFVRVTEELRKRGHEVTPFMGDATTRPEWDGFDACLNWNEPNLFIGCRSKRRVLYQMLNDFSFIRPGFDEWVDQYIGVCPKHTAYVAAQCPKPEKWRTVGLGCDPELYSDARVPGRVVYCSSPDRGLHWLLSVWPDIRKAVPEAHLRVFYHWSHDGLLGIREGDISPQGVPYHQNIVEVAQRARYIKRAMAALKPLGVEHVGSVSRERMAREWSEASVLAYPCDPVAFSEGFSVSILEAHASYTVPVITDADCLGEVYEGSGARIVASPVRDHLQRFTEEVVDALKTPGSVTTTRTFAEQRTWAKTAEQLEEHLR